MDTTVNILVAHEWASARTSIAALLGDLRPDFSIRAVLPEEIDAAIAASLAPVVIGGLPSATVRSSARGWIGLYPDAQNIALVGAGDDCRVLDCPAFDDLVAAIDRLTAQPGPDVHAPG